MMKISRFFAMTGFSFLFSLAATAVESIGNTSDPTKDLVETFESAMLAMDHSRISSLYIANCQMVTSTDNFLSGSTAVETYMKNLFTGFKIEDAEITVAETENIGGSQVMMYGAYRFDMIARSDQKRAVLEGKYTVLAVRQGGRLKILQHTTFVPEPPLDFASRYTLLAKEFETALEEEDIDHIVGLYTASGEHLGSTGTTAHGQTELRSYFTQFLSQFEVKEVTVDIDRAQPIGEGHYYASGKYQFEVLPPNGAATVSINGNYTMVVKDGPQGLKVDKMVAMIPSTPASAN